ncbi:MAG TPA: asparagine synthase (glutamine-hydrolyzing) [Rhodanobacteraceae bacterium]|nr:asparagine synthase (glutamine-hydrolyzing) [Rhodanobacteraceae bacterium]
MCGICGALVLDPAKAPHDLESRVRTMLAAMDHRGPSGGMVCARPNLVMAVNRLAIRGVDAHRPPLIEGEEGVLVACNGEIDNHRELRKSLESHGHRIPAGSDVSVIAPLYLAQELAFPDALRGVFAVALWDSRRQRLVLARDRVGERHLHYMFADGVLYFASELAALLRAKDAGGAVDPIVLPHYLLSGYCPAPQDLVKGCRKLRPGELLVIEPAVARHERFWSPPLGKLARKTPAPDVFDDVFRNAVRHQTDVDVNYGVMLSGGVDSALVTAVARSVRPERTLTAYCARFAEASFDEGEHASEVARMLGCEFVPVVVSPEDFPCMLRHLIESTGELLADPAWIPQAMVARRASEDVPMLLGGEGADELFGGYPTYLGASLAARYGRLPKILRGVLRRVVERLPVTDKNMSVSFMLKRFVHGETLGGLARHKLWTASVAPEQLARLGIDLPSEVFSGGDGLEVMDAVQRHDFTQSLPEALLAKADRGGMCYGVETRAPFLDQRVVEFAAALPVSERVRGFTTKVFLKKYASGYLPGSIVNRRKRGLSVPLGAWLRGPLLDWARSRLTGPTLRDVGIDTEQALQLFSEHCSRRRDHARAIWTLVVLSEWLEWRARLQPAALPTVRHPPQGGTANSATQMIRTK